MNIIVNGEHKNIGEASSLCTLLETLGIVQNAVVIEHNGSIINFERFQTTVLKEGDVLELVRFVGGG